jgi:hypothetical protein
MSQDAYYDYMKQCYRESDAEIMRTKNIEIRREYYDWGGLKVKAYYFNNQLHRDDGPALIEVDEVGDIESTRYFINGKEVEAFC